MVIGVKTQIWNNQIKSFLLLLGFPLLLLAITWGFFAALFLFYPDILVKWFKIHADSVQFAGWQGLKYYGYIAVLFACTWYVIAYLIYQPLINGLTGATVLSRNQSPRLYNLLENLCISRGIKMPALYVIETTSLNAYASGLSPSSVSITVTQGLLDSLNDQELEAVLGHELTHIINNDIQLVLVGVIFTGMLGLTCDFLSNISRPTLFESKEMRKTESVAFIALALFMIGRVFALAMRFAISQEREYMADAGSVELTKNPDALISALKKISINSHIQGFSGELSQMCIEDANDDFIDWFSTHPSIEDRIAALKGMGGRD